jgi:hypothetical protein
MDRTDPRTAGVQALTTPIELAPVVWLLAGSDAAELETAVLDGLDELDEQVAVEDVPSGCVSFERARPRRAATRRTGR